MTSRLAAERRRLESGQALVQFALMAAGLMAMLALGIDFGMVAVQKRFDQNAADAAGLAAAGALARRVAVDTGGQVFFPAEALSVAQDRLTQLATDANAHAGLSSRTNRVARLELSGDGGATWCAAPCGGSAPAPSTAAPYLVRVSVSSSTTGFFAGFIGSGGAASTNCPPTGANGLTSCAVSTVSIAGSSSVPTGMQVIPATLPDCAVTMGGSAAWQVHELWGSNSSPCIDTGGWKNLLDFTPYADPVTDWPTFNDFHWDGFVADPNYDGTGRRRDLVYWIAHGFGGQVTSGEVPLHTGTWVLTGQSGTAQGCIARGFYGGGGACDINGRTDDYSASYFFSSAKLLPSNYGWFDCSQSKNDPVVKASSMRVGCRDVAVAAWDSPQVRVGQSWENISSGQPDRVHIRRFYVFRFYCGWSSDNTRCDQRPPSTVLPGCPSAGSGICGRLSPVQLTGNCPMCVVGPSVTVNALRMQD
ncbi:MAG TPA: pilus assembly protein TadG-related protein [Chloroflexota bacterium]|nr:pilus assembly protein TadG-related protein [Chloroflexota bacterium]